MPVRQNKLSQIKIFREVISEVSLRKGKETTTTWQLAVHVGSQR